MKNCTLVTVSAKLCEPVYAKALGISECAVKALGVSRTDRYFDEAYRADCVRRFFEDCPQAKGKRIVLWAPTFRGNAGNPRLEGAEAINEVQKRLGNDYFFVKKLHPHFADSYGEPVTSMLTEEVMAAADVLVTDYSSVLFDFMAYKKPVVLFAPDGAAYASGRGFYLDYASIPAFMQRRQMHLWKRWSVPVRAEWQCLRQNMMLFIINIWRSVTVMPQSALYRR